MQNLPTFTSFPHYHLLDFPVARQGIKHSNMPVSDKAHSVPACRKDVYERRACCRAIQLLLWLLMQKKLLSKRLLWNQAHPSSRLWSRGHQAGPALMDRLSVRTTLCHVAPLQLRLFSTSKVKQRLSDVCLKQLGYCFFLGNMAVQRVISPFSQLSRGLPKQR